MKLFVAHLGLWVYANALRNCVHNNSTNTVLNAGSAPNPHDQLREETERTINKLRDFDLRDMVRRDTKQTMDSFMPQWHFNPYMAASLLTAFVCAM
mmetsp:Transcript_70602/g.195096  ORF Transcript_70602/g.195096 Transcript_70602/m.195096 type:complete len:96 (-) Transcript_70602:10-297(-)